MGKTLAKKTAYIPKAKQLQDEYRETRKIIELKEKSATMNVSKIIEKKKKRMEST